MRLQGHTAVVTGAGGGIGRAASERFAADGASVIVVDRDATSGHQTVKGIQSEGGSARFVEADVTVADDVERIFADTDDRFGTPDILLNCAAVHQAVDFLEMSEEQFSHVMRVNVNSVYLLSQRFARGLVAAELPGSIINISSVNARMATPRAVAYAASKGAISSFTAAAALALAKHRIRVNAIGPGTIATPMTVGLQNDAELLGQVLSRTPLQRLGTPEEIAGVAAFLASDDSAYMTGQTLFVDGGRMALSFTVDD